MSDVEQRPRLAEALGKVVPEAAKRQPALASFRNVNQLAQAVAICAAEDIDLHTLGQRMVGPPRRSLRNAVWDLKPELRGTDAIRKATATAKQLLELSPKQKG